MTRQTFISIPVSANLLLIETIRIQNGRVRNIKYHNLRCNHTRKELFKSKDKIDLRKHIETSTINAPEVKCRITYNNEIQNVEYESYTIRKIQSLQPIEIDKFEYSHKFADREMLKRFFLQKGDRDDILMTKDGFITDTYYANIALLKDGIWYTPKKPLLPGSTRARLLNQNKIEQATIHIDQLKEYTTLSIFNAMIPFKKLLIKI